MGKEQNVVIDHLNEIEELDNIQQEVDKLLATISEKSVKELKSNDAFQNKDVDSVIADYKWQLYDKIVNVYDKRSEKDNVIKEKYAVWLIRLLGIQLIALNLIFFFQGFKLIELPESTLNIFITASIGEIFLLVNIIVKYLFTDNLTKLLTKILSDGKDDDKKIM